MSWNSTQQLCNWSVAHAISRTPAPNFRFLIRNYAIPDSPLIDHQLLIPIFTPPPDDIVPSEKIARSPDIGTPWRQANWRFLQAQVRVCRPTH